MKFYDAKVEYTFEGRTTKTGHGVSAHNEHGAVLKVEEYMKDAYLPGTVVKSITVKERK